MSTFLALLRKHNLERHDKRPLWQYDLNDKLLAELRKRFQDAVTIDGLARNDCALYFAAWWQLCYDGGIPKREAVFESIGQCRITQEAFYGHAKEGLRQLGINLIRSAQNTLFFRTLLYQGGLPIKHMLANKSQYQIFLEKLIDINPYTIDEFKCDFTVINLLPKSLRNDDIYGFCLKLIREILDNTVPELIKQLEDNNLTDIKSALLTRKSKKNAHSVNLKTANINWILDNEKKEIYLDFAFTKMNDDTFKQQFALQHEPQSHQYKLYYNETVLYRFDKNNIGEYLPRIINNKIGWLSTEERPELYLLSSEGEKISCPNLLNLTPSLEIPTLWINVSDDGKWKLLKGTNTAEEEAIVICPPRFQSNANQEGNIISEDNFTINSLSVKLFLFKNELTLRGDNEVKTFKTATTTFDWHIIDARPNIIRSANIPIIRNTPKVYIYNAEGNRITNYQTKWRAYGVRSWQIINGNVSPGLIEIKINSSGTEETELVFNIADLEIDTTSSCLSKATLNIMNNMFSIELTKTDATNITIKENTQTIQIENLTPSKAPSGISCHATYSNQQRGLSFTLQSPFSGIQLMDKDGNLLTDGYNFVLGNLYGYGITPRPNSDSKIKMYNTQRPDMPRILTVKAHKGRIPMTEFEQEMATLLNLSSDLNAQIKFELCENHLLIRHTYHVNRYGIYLNVLENDQNNLIIALFDFNQNTVEKENLQNFKLLALRTNSSEMEIKELILDNATNHFIISLEDNAPHLIFGKTNTKQPVKPALINAENYTVDEVVVIEEMLLSKYDSHLWNRLKSLYRICQEHNIEPSLFPEYKICAKNPILAARLFLVLLLCTENEDYVTNDCKKNESNLAFSFSWISNHSWVDAIGWINPSSFETIIITRELQNYIYSKLWTAIKTQEHEQKSALVAHKTSIEIKTKESLEVTFSFHEFQEFKVYILGGQWNRQPNNHTLINIAHDLNNTLGKFDGKYFGQALPIKSPQIPPHYSDLLGIYTDRPKFELFAKGPLSIALSLTGKDNSLWEHEHIRRNVQYCQDLEPAFFAKAISYFITKLLQ